MKQQNNLFKDMKKWNNKLWQKESIMVKPGDAYQINIVVCNKYYIIILVPQEIRPQLKSIPVELTINSHKQMTS